MIISHIAILKIKEIYRKNTDKIIVLSLKMTGCSGYEYVMDLKSNNKDIILEEHSDIVIGIDKNFLDQFNETLLDYKEDKLESKFVFSNPNITSYCGCGQSFNL